MGVSSFKFVEWAPKDASFVHQSAFWPFKVVKGRVIQGRWFWYQSKARIRLPISYCDYGPILHRFWDTVTYLLAKNSVFLLHFCYPSLIRRPRSLCSLEFRISRWT